jgi:hypothetical protein
MKIMYKHFVDQIFEHPKKINPNAIGFGGMEQFPTNKIEGFRKNRSNVSNND